MKRIAVIAILTTGCLGGVQAQTFLDRLKKPAKDKAVVTVTQDAAIDKLVNGDITAKTTVVNKKEHAASTKKESAHAASTKKESAHAASTTTTPPTSSSTIEEPDMSNKVMKNSYKVMGYRVQAFAGGNKRNDRQAAENVGNAIKRRFPEQPIYVHFYSPRWICRVGNFRTYEEAHAMLVEIREMGYKQASIVKGKISVQY